MRAAFHGLYAQLAAALVALLAVVALSYAGLSQLLAEQDHERGQQALQRDIAEHLRDEMHLLQQGVLDEQRVEQLMHAAMLINPAIEIYLLDTKGQIRAYSAPPGAVSTWKSAPISRNRSSPSCPVTSSTCARSVH